LTEENAEISLPLIDKAAIDVSEEGSWLICAERAQIVSAEDFSNTVIPRNFSPLRDWFFSI
jgi:hypothetical protein